MMINKFKKMISSILFHWRGVGLPARSRFGKGRGKGYFRNTIIFLNFPDYGQALISVCL